MVSYLEELLNDVLYCNEMDSQPGWGGKKPTAVAMESASRAVQQFIVDSAIQPDNELLKLPNEIKRTATDYSVDGASCPHRRRFCNRTSFVTFKQFEGDTVWCPIETAAYDLEWPVGDLATQLFGSDGMSNG